MKKVFWLIVILALTIGAPMLAAPEDDECPTCPKNSAIIGLNPGSGI